MNQRLLNLQRQTVKTHIPGTEKKPLIDGHIDIDRQSMNLKVLNSKSNFHMMCTNICSTYFIYFPMFETCFICIIIYIYNLL
jgi:hypothetical protein